MMNWEGQKEVMTCSEILSQLMTGRTGKLLETLVTTANALVGSRNG
jgi:hypothetical protein